LMPSGKSFAVGAGVDVRGRGLKHLALRHDGSPLVNQRQAGDIGCGWDGNLLRLSEE